MRIYASGSPGKSMGLPEYYIDRPHVMTSFWDVVYAKRGKNNRVIRRIRIIRESRRGKK